MKAIAVRPGVKDSIHMRDMPDPKPGPGEVLVKMLRVGLCGTDEEINRGLYGKAPEGEEFLVIGHENLGIVEEVGKTAKEFRAGDLVVATVRRPCAVCENCKAGETDMCSSGLYTERGIMRRHGFLAEYCVESPEYLHKIPTTLREIGVLLEPTSVVEKGIDHAFRIQRRLIWRPELGLVLGAGPVGLLGAAVLRARGIRTVVVGREPPTDLRAQIATQIGAEYISVATSTVLDLPGRIGAPDIVLEATGSARVVFDAMEILGRNAILCLLSVTGGSGTNEEPINRINQRIVLGNQVVFGSVNANSRHFATGVKDLALIEDRYCGALARLLTDRLPWHAYKTWFANRGSGIKTTLEIAAEDADPRR